jgi:hypothetical protein
MSHNIKKSHWKYQDSGMSNKQWTYRRLPHGGALASGDPCMSPVSITVNIIIIWGLGKRGTKTRKKKHSRVDTDDVSGTAVAEEWKERVELMRLIAVGERSSQSTSQWRRSKSTPVGSCLCIQRISHVTSQNRNVLPETLNR